MSALERSLSLSFLELQTPGGRLVLASGRANRRRRRSAIVVGVANGGRGLLAPGVAPSPVVFAPHDAADTSAVGVAHIATVAVDAAQAPKEAANDATCGSHESKESAVPRPRRKSDPQPRRQLDTAPGHTAMVGSVALSGDEVSEIASSLCSSTDTSDSDLDARPTFQRSRSDSYARHGRHTSVTDLVGAAVVPLARIGSSLLLNPKRGTRLDKYEGARRLARAAVAAKSPPAGPRRAIGRPLARRSSQPALSSGPRAQPLRRLGHARAQSALDMKALAALSPPHRRTTRRRRRSSVSSAGSSGVAARAATAVRRRVATAAPNSPPLADSAQPLAVGDEAVGPGPDAKSGTAPGPESAATAVAAVAAGFLAVLVGGCLSMALFELATLAEPDCRNMLTAFQFLSTALTTFSLRHLHSNRVPLQYHLVLAALHAGGALLSNTALAWGVPTPLFLVIRNGNLVANIVSARLLLKRAPSTLQYIAVAVVTAGMMVTTWFSSQSRATANDSDQQSTEGSAAAHEVSEFAAGLALLVTSLFVNALLSLAQERVFRTCVLRCMRVDVACANPHCCACVCVHACVRCCRYGRKASGEVLFFSSVMGLPAILPAVPDLTPRIWRWLQPSSTIVSVVTASGNTLALPVPLPKALVLVSNVATSYLCKYGVLSLMARTSSMTATLSITVYRVSSLLISLLVFNAPPSPSREVWLGAAMVFSGSLLYVTTKSAAFNGTLCGRRSEPKASTPAVHAKQA